MPIVKLTDLSAPELDPYVRLTQAQLRSLQKPHHALIIAESEKVIAAALDAGYEPVSMLMEQKKADALAETLLLRCPGIPVYTGSRELLSSLTGYELTRGVLCAMRRKAQSGMAAVCRGAHRIAVLEGIVDTTNMGAIFRSAAALHMDAVLLDSTCCDPLSRRALRVSMGTVFKVPWAVIPQGAWPQDAMAQLRRDGFCFAAMALSRDSIPVDDAQLRQKERLAIVLGTEGDGLKEATIAACDHTVIIPMSHGVDSLNVAAASAVAFWELRRRANA